MILVYMLFGFPFVVGGRTQVKSGVKEREQINPFFGHHARGASGTITSGSGSGNDAVRAIVLLFAEVVVMSRLKVVMIRSFST